MRDDITPFVVIPCTGGKSILVDQADADFVMQHSWQVRQNPGRGRSWYVWRTLKGVGTKSRATTVYLHRILLDAPKGMQVDHINGNPLDNRRANLRLCTNSQNHANMIKPRQGTRKTPTSQFKGVVFWKNGWQAQTSHRGKFIHIGRYKTEEEAARAYDARATEIWGEFARLNFPLDKTEAA